MNLYIDSAIFCAAVMNYLCLDVSAKLMKTVIKKRILAAGAVALSLFGIINAFYMKYQVIGFIFYITVIRLVFGESTPAGHIRRFGICIGVSLFFSSVLLTLIPADKLGNVSVDGRMFFCAEDLYFYSLLIPSYILVRIIIFLISENKRVYSVVLDMGGETAEAVGFIDTGNSLTEPESGKPVIVAERSLFSSLTEEFKYIPYKTVDGDEKLMRVYRLRELYFTEEKKSVRDVYVSFSDKQLSGGKYQVLLNNSIFKN